MTARFTSAGPVRTSILVLDKAPSQSGRRRTECLGGERVARRVTATTVGFGTSNQHDDGMPVHAVLFNRNADLINLAANRKVLSLGAIEVVAQPYNGADLRAQGVYLPGPGCL
jgi:hypothetical protein